MVKRILDGTVERTEETVMIIIEHIYKTNTSVQFVMDVKPCR